jgi:hypothetical protein
MHATDSKIEEKVLIRTWEECSSHSLRTYSQNIPKAHEWNLGIIEIPSKKPIDVHPPKKILVDESKPDI